MSNDDYVDLINQLSALELTGGIIYDAIICKAAEKMQVDILLTYNTKHFKQIWEYETNRIKSPKEFSINELKG